MSKQEEIKQALAAASTDHEWDTDGTFIQWKDGHVLQGTYRQIAITQAKTPEMFNNPNHENDANLIAKAPEYIAYLLEENERLRSALETTLFHLKKEYYMSAEDAIEEALAVGQEGEGNQ